MDVAGIILAGGASRRMQAGGAPIDKALLPLQLDVLDTLVDDLTIARIPDAGHFVPWEKPEAVAAPLRSFLRAHQGS